MTGIKQNLLAELELLRLRVRVLKFVNNELLIACADAHTFLRVYADDAIVARVAETISMVERILEIEDGDDDED